MENILKHFSGTFYRCIHNKTHGKKIPGQKTPRIKNNKAKLDIKHYCKIGQKTLLKKTLSILAIIFNELFIRILALCYD